MISPHRRDQPSVGARSGLNDLRLRRKNMTKKISRREALKTAGAISAAAMSLQYPAPFVLAALGANEKLNVALIGCGGRGRSAHLPVLLRENLVAVADADETNARGAIKDIAANAEQWGAKGLDPSRIQLFWDYRELFDKIENQIDTVFIATPDHQHANPALRAIKAGKHVFCEKPLTHDISEARILGDAARQSKVVTQMGNQGSATGNHQVLAEYLQAGVIGKVKEVHGWYHWSTKFGGFMEIPENDTSLFPELHWDHWLGPASEHPYSALYRALWYGWCDFGTGALGGWATHVFDAIFFALKLGAPQSVELVEAAEISDERYPKHSKIRYEFSARGELPPVTVYWYDGSLPNKDSATKKKRKTVPYLPEVCGELKKKYNFDVADAGSVIVGEKGMIYCQSHGGPPTLFPLELRNEFKAPKATLPRPTGGIFEDFFRAVKQGGLPAFSNFADFSGPFVEGLLAGHLTIRAGLNNRVEWDGAKMQCTNLPELNRWVKQERRKGWELE